MNWTQDNILEFINHYETEPILWNPRAAGHKRMHLVFKAWARIHNGLGWDCKINDLKNKRNSLMAAYRTCINRKKKAIRNGTEPEEITWFAFDALHSFLGPIYDKKTVNEPDNEEDNEEQENTATEENKHSSPRIVKRPRHNLPSERNTTRQQTPQVQEISQLKHFCYNDEYEIFGKLITSKIRKIQNPEIKETLMNDIHNFVCKACIEDTQTGQAIQSFVYTNNDEQMCEFSSEKFTPSANDE